MQPFIMPYQISIGDLNYGNHVGGDALIRILHEARIRYLNYLGNFSEDSLENHTGLIMLHLDITFKQQLFHGDHIAVHVEVESSKKMGFVLLYQVYKEHQILSHTARTHMTYFNYEDQKIVPPPTIFYETLISQIKRSDLL